MRKTRRRHRGRKTRKGGDNGNNNPPILYESKLTQQERKQLEQNILKSNTRTNEQRAKLQNLNKERRATMLYPEQLRQYTIAQQKKRDIQRITAARENHLKNPSQPLWRRALGINYT
jgi:hypothetical protein